MVDYQKTIKAILKEKGNQKELISLKILASEAWRLDFLAEKNLRNIGELNSELAELHESLTKNNLNGFDLRLKSAENMLITCYLKPLSLADGQIDFLLQVNNKSLSIRITKVLGEALWIKSFLSSNTTTWRKAYDELLSFLELYGFKTTYYLKRLILSKLKTGKCLSGEFIQKIRIRDQVYEEIFNFKNPLKKVFLKDLMQKMLNFLKRNPNFGCPEKMTFDIMSCLPEKEFDPKPLIQIVIDEIFFSIVTIFHHSQINALVYSFEKNFKSLSESALCMYSMAMEIIVPNGENSNFIRPGHKFFISPIGTEESSRFLMDRITLIGRFANNCLGSDVFVDKNFTDFNKLHLIVTSAEDGYYIADISTGRPVSRKLLNDETAEIKVGMIIGLGPRLLLMVKDFKDDDNDILVSFVVVSKFYMYFSEIAAILKKNGEETCIGRAPGPEGMMINEPKQDYKGKADQVLISRRHSSLRFDNGKVLIRNFGTYGTYICLKNYSEYIQYAPSGFFRIEDGQNYYSNDFIFKFEISCNY